MSSVAVDCWGAAVVPASAAMASDGVRYVTPGGGTMPTRRWPARRGRDGGRVRWRPSGCDSQLLNGTEAGALGPRVGGDLGRRRLPGPPLEQADLGHGAADAGQAGRAGAAAGRGGAEPL